MSTGVKPMNKSVSYDDFLMAKLKDRNYAAGYVETHLELEKDEAPDPALLALALKDVAQALAGDRLTPEEVKIHLEKLDLLLSNGGSEVIYDLAAWLQCLGLKLTVKVDNEPEKIQPTVTDNVVTENVAEELVKT
jgi:DNA-binding phage protein